MSDKQTSKNQWLGNVFENAGEVFEKFNPSAFRFLAATLPYSTPYPVAWLTMKSAESFLNFTPTVAFVFVYGLEGIGLWFTSLFVDSIIDFIRSRNAKTSILVVLFGLVVAAYVTLLISLNVTLKVASGDTNPALERVITLLCFLPLLTGVGNGYYKWKLEQNQKTDKREQEEVSRNDTIRQEQREDRLKAKMIKAGMNPMMSVYQETTSAPPSKPHTILKDDWRLLTPGEKYEVVHDLSVEEIMKKYPISRSTAFAWKGKQL